MKKRLAQGMALFIFCSMNTVIAGEVSILAADFRHTGGNTWNINITLQHEDTGWDHYANRWRVVDAKGNLLGDRVLHHPHVDEQPFTRGLSQVTLPDGITTVYIEAQDKIHGWSPIRLEVDLKKIKAGRVHVKAADLNHK